MSPSCGSHLTASTTESNQWMLLRVPVGAARPWLICRRPPGGRPGERGQIPRPPCPRVIPRKQCKAMGRPQKVLREETVTFRDIHVRPKSRSRSDQGQEDRMEISHPAHHKLSPLQTNLYICSIRLHRTMMIPNLIWITNAFITAAVHAALSRTSPAVVWSALACSSSKARKKKQPRWEFCAPVAIERWGNKPLNFSNHTLPEECLKWGWSKTLKFEPFAHGPARSVWWDSLL